MFTASRKRWGFIVAVISAVNSACLPPPASFTTTNPICVRPNSFPQKIVRGVLAFQYDKSKRLVLGDLTAVVDWGYAGDYAEAMTRILGHATPEDFVVAAGEPHTVSDFLQIACEIAGVDWHECAVTDSSLLKKRPVLLMGDSGKLRRLTGWQPKTSFRSMIENMLAHARKTNL